MTLSYNYWIVALSFLVALAAAYRAILIADASPNQDAAEKWIRILVGGSTLGTGVWGMHFVGMLAAHLPVPLYYNTWVTMLSGLFAIATMIFALWQIQQQPQQRIPLLGIAIAMGAGISIMHYTGMAAIQMQPPIHYKPGLFALSIIIAVSAAFVAVKVMLLAPNYRTYARVRWLRLGVAIVLAIGISGMHYTGMAAAEFRPDSYCISDPNSLTPSWLLVQVSIMLVLVLLLGRVAIASHENPSTNPRMTMGLPIVVLLIMSSLVFLAWKDSKESALRQTRFEFEHLVQDLENGVEQAITAHGTLLHELSALYAASKQVDPDGFQTYATRLINPVHLPGIQTVGILRPEDSKQPGDLRTNCHSNSLKVRSDDLSPLVQIAPAAGSLPRLPWGDKLQRGLEKSLISERITLVSLRNPLDKQVTGIDAALVYPIFHNGKPHDTPALRCANLLGWVYTGVNLQKMLSPPNPAGGVAALYEGNTTLESARIWQQGDPNRLRNASMLHSTTKSIRTSNNSLTLTVSEMQTPDNALLDESTFITMLGSASALFIAALVLLLSQARIRAFNSAAALAKELVEKETLVQLVSEQNIRLETSAQMKSRFFATMSHELRTPLNSILGFSEILVDPHTAPLDETQKELLKHIQDSGKHLLHLVNDTLDMAKIEAGKMPLHEDIASVHGMLSDYMDNIQVLAKTRKIHLALDADQDLGLIWTDVGKVEQIVNNLLSNAIKFSPIEGHITLHAKRVNRAQVGHLPDASPSLIFADETVSTEHYLEICVEDHGIGIAEEDFPKIFQPFSQIDSSLSRQFNGTGLGLVLTKNLVEHLGGTIALQSRSKQGSRFTVWLPWALEAKTKTET